ncbi:unnamed protein product [Phytophthora fragariaefolia]|uniref:Unnamed protein product n=1 Tax=Phytophthora fragariaefolia TaxID=1490495 RepID=A0A9W7D3H9_9STRA|nr:unnamed protein product [Phytophthora fragariaefolia]
MEQENERAGEGATVEASDTEVARGRTDAEDRGADTIDDEPVMRTAAMQLENAPSPTLSSLGLRIQIPNPFDATEVVDEDVEMPTASPENEERFSSQRVAAAPALPQPPRFAGRTMQDRRDFMQKYETYLAAINALQTPYTGAFAMPVGACVESKTKRMIARYEFNSTVNLITEQQWIGYFMQAKLPSLVDYAAVDDAMKTLKMKITWPEPESRMMNFQADLEGILDKFNLTDQAFEHEQRRLVRYLSNALEPPSFKAAVTTKLTLQRNKQFKHERHARELRERREAARGTPVKKFSVMEAGKPAMAEDRGSVVAAVDGVAVKARMLDTGADASLVARGVMDALEAMGKTLSVRPVAGITLSPVGKGAIAVTRSVIFCEVVLTTPAGPLMLRNLSCYVEEHNNSMEMIVGRPILKLLGYSTDKLLVEARSISPEWELGGHRTGGGESDAAPTALQKMCRLQESSRDPTLTTEEAEDVERQETRTATPCMRPTNLTEVIQHLEKKVEVATKMGLTLDGRAKLATVIHFSADCFRVEFGNDPPVRVVPLKVRLKDGVRPVKAQPRRYSPTDREFLDRHTRALLDNGLVFLNHRSCWASAPNIVRKKEQGVDPSADPRMTIDSRGVNERTEAMPWPMPVLEVVIGELEGAKYFFVLDWFRGYWQLPLHPDSQELFSFVTHRGIYTPTRVPMGATDAVAYCQGVVEEIFGGLLGQGLLCWLDDILGYAETEEELLA